MSYTFPLSSATAMNAENGANQLEQHMAPNLDAIHHSSHLTTSIQLTHSRAHTPALPTPHHHPQLYLEPSRAGTPFSSWSRYGTPFDNSAGRESDSPLIHNGTNWPVGYTPLPLEHQQDQLQQALQASQLENSVLKAKLETMT